MDNNHIHRRLNTWLPNQHKTKRPTTKRITNTNTKQHRTNTNRTKNTKQNKKLNQKRLHKLKKTTKMYTEIILSTISAILIIFIIFTVIGIIKRDKIGENKKMKFNYGDKVKITSGFYNGMTGTITHGKNDGDIDNSWEVYDIEIDKIKTEITLPDEKLELIHFQPKTNNENTQLLKIIKELKKEIKQIKKTRKQK